MSEIDELQAALQPEVATIIAMFGRLVHIRPFTKVELPGNESSESWTRDIARENLIALLNPLSRRTAERLYGSVTEATMTAVFGAVDGAFPAIDFRDAVRVVEGPFAGTLWVAEAEGIPDPVSATLTVPLKRAPTAAVIP